MLSGLVAKVDPLCAGINLRGTRRVEKVRDGGSSRLKRCCMLIPIRIFSILKILILIGGTLGSIRSTKCFEEVLDG